MHDNEDKPVEMGPRARRCRGFCGGWRDPDTFGMSGGFHFNVTAVEPSARRAHPSSRLLVRWRLRPDGTARRGSRRWTPCAGEDDLDRATAQHAAFDGSTAPPLGRHRFARSGIRRGRMDQARAGRGSTIRVVGAPELPVDPRWLRSERTESQSPDRAEVLVVFRDEAELVLERSRSDEGVGKANTELS
jgi:hypothetical protein